MPNYNAVTLSFIDAAEEYLESAERETNKGQAQRDESRALACLVKAVRRMAVRLDCVVDDEP